MKILLVNVYHQVIYQLTCYSFQIDYGAKVSNNICLDCQNRVKLAYKIRGELIKALERKTKKTIQVYQIFSKSDSNDSKNHKDGAVVHEELVEITEEIDEDYNVEGETNEQVFLEVTKNDNDEEANDDEQYISEAELITNDQNSDEPLDAVSFLLEKKELFQNESATAKKGRRSHRCEVCEKTFMRKSNLVDHLRLHANVR